MGRSPPRGRSGPAVASGTRYVDITEDPEPGTYRAAVTTDDATGVEPADGDALSTAKAYADLFTALD